MFDLEKKKKKKDRLLKFFNDQYCVLILHSFSKEKKKKISFYFGIQYDKIWNTKYEFVNLKMNIELFITLNYIAGDDLKNLKMT